MKNPLNRLQAVAAIAAIAAVIIVAVPFIAVLGFALRFVIVVGAAIVLVVTLLGYLTSRSFREWFDAYAEPIHDYKGLQQRGGVALHPSHSWARIDGEVLVGVDDVLQATLGPVEEVDLPSAGCRVRQGDPLFRLRHGDRVVDVRAPVSGTVVATNDTLRESPRTINDEPFAGGWAVRLQGDDVRADRRRLLRGRRAVTWFHNEVDRVIGALIPHGHATPMLPDGGVVVSELHRHIDDASWERLERSLFAPNAGDAERT
jgi:glycine cleavage system H protein